MTYQRFGELWDALVANRPKRSVTTESTEQSIAPQTKRALAAYATGDTSWVQAARQFIKEQPPA